MENIKSNKIQTEGLIFFVLLSGSRHTDEIKDIIDKKFTSVKLGTLYASISKMLASKTIQEFRASSGDGSRRKYYKITPSGLKVYNSKYASLFEGVELLPPADNNFENSLNKIVSKRQSKGVQKSQDFETVNSEQSSKNLVEETESKVDYSEYFNAINDYQNSDVDFSALENSTLDNSSLESANNSLDDVKIDSNNDFSDFANSFNDKNVFEAQNNIQEQKTTKKPLFDREEIEKSSYINHNNEEKGVDYDSFVSSHYEYSSVLNKIYPKQTNYVYNEDNKEDIEPITSEKPLINNANVNNDWSDIYALSEKDGIKMHTSSDTNRYRGSKILVNKLLFFTSLALLGAVFIEFILFNLIFLHKVDFSSISFITITAIFSSLALVAAILFILNPIYAKKDLPKFINALEISLILAISAIIITFATTAIKGIDFYNGSETFNSLILPSIMFLNAPLFTVIEYAFSKLEYFQSL